MTRFPKVMTEHRPGLERDSRLGFDALACPVRDLSILLAMPVFGLIFTIGVVGGFPGALHRGCRALVR